MLCQVFRSSACSPAQSFVAAGVRCPYLVRGQVGGERQSLWSSYEIWWFPLFVLISSLSGARIYLTTRDQVTQNKCVPCFYIVLRANYRSRAVQRAWAVWAVCRSDVERTVMEDASFALVQLFLIQCYVHSWVSPGPLHFLLLRPLLWASFLLTQI